MPQDADDVPAPASAVAVQLAIKSVGPAECDQTLAWDAELIDSSDQQLEYDNIRIDVPELGRVRLATGERRVGSIVFLPPNSEQPAAFPP